MCETGIPVRDRHHSRRAIALGGLGDVSVQIPPLAGPRWLPMLARRTNNAFSSLEWALIRYVAADGKLNEKECSYGN
jgi:capsid protein